MHRRWKTVALACALGTLTLWGRTTPAAEPGFTLLYSADDRGEVTPCG